MPTNRTLMGAAAFSLALAGGGAAGALLGTPVSSGAQDGTEEAATAEEDGPRRGGGHRGASLAVAAEAIGITADELRTALESGQSIAQVAEANDVEVQTVIDALVADGTERLEAAIDALPDRITELVEREGLPDRGGPGGRFHGARGLALDAAADAIGITANELRDALRDGSTIAEVAQANDVEVQVVVDTMVAAAEARIDEAVAAGRLSEDEADDRKAELTERIEAAVEGEGSLGRSGPPMGAPPTDDEVPEAEGSASA